MPLTIDQLEDELLDLPRENRARLAVALIDSISPPVEEEIDSPAQLAEYARRSEELIDHPDRAIPYEDVMARIGALLAKA